MIYTLGKPEIYETYLENDENPRKLGRDSSDYVGGSVWKNIEDVRVYLERTGQSDLFLIYGVIADWETQTEKTENGWNNLLVSSKIVRIAQ